MKLTIILFRNNFRFSEKQQRREGSSCPCLPHLASSQQPGAPGKTSSALTRQFTKLGLHSHFTCLSADCSLFQNGDHRHLENNTSKCK